MYKRQQFGENNLAKLQTLFTFLLQFIHDCAIEFDPEVNGVDDPHLLIIDKILPFMYDLAQFAPSPCAKAVLSVLQEKHEEYCKKPKAVVGFETVRER